MKRVLFIPSCEEVHEGLTEFMEGAQPWHARLGYRLHFLLCAACRGLLRAFRDLPGLFRRGLAPADQAPPEAEAALGKVLRDLHQPRGGGGA
jgi:hypothetical protein